MCTTYQVLKDFSGAAAAIIAGIAAVCVTYRLGKQQLRLGKEQARVAREKLRLDLYDRRWKVFRSIFDFYYVMIAWTGTDEQKAVRDQFFMAYQESAFLFDPADHVEEILKDLNDKGRRMMDYKDGSLEGWDAKSKADLVSEIGKIQTFGFEEGLAKLKNAMVKYLGFRHLYDDASTCG
jgi:hypothetical protein